MIYISEIYFPVYGSLKLLVFGVSSVAFGGAQCKT